MAATQNVLEYSSSAPNPISPYPRLPPHLLTPSGEPDYLRLILTSKVYDLIKETPLVLATGLSKRLGNEIWLKREDLQEVFSFKIRGAYNFMANIPVEERWKGVVTCSAGTFSTLLRHQSPPPLLLLFISSEKSPTHPSIALNRIH